MTENSAFSDAQPRELTFRAIVTGMVLGAILAPCNVYSGLKIGWSFNMSITALLLAYVFWVPITRKFGLNEWGMLESNINQTTASSAASIISGGLVAPLPALAIISGENLPLMTLAAWVFGVSFLGIWVAWYLQPRLIVGSNLVFPAGMATAETLRDIFSKGREAKQRVTVLLSALFGAAGINIIDTFLWRIPRWAPGVTSQKLTLSFDPSLLLLGFGSIIGLRAGLGLLTGALIAWGILAPALLETGIVKTTSEPNWFQPLVGWLLWPGVAMMVTASLTSLAANVIAGRRKGRIPGEAAIPVERKKTRLMGFALTSLLVVILEITVFGIHWTMAILAIPLAFLLASVAARVVGETGIPPIGAIGKISQLSFGILAPQQVVTNLMTANVAGGAAGQSADLLNDLKAGHEIGARPSRQVFAQCFGVLTGSIVGSIVYLALIKNPAEQLITPEWPAPAVATWKAVAETLSGGLSGIPQTALVAMLIGAFLGFILALVERMVSDRVLAWIPSGASLGLAFVIPASTSITLFLGALIGSILHQLVPKWSARFLLSLAAGLVAGESLFGVINVWI